MSQRPSVSGREAIRAFAKFGFVEVRVRGSHRVLRKDGHPAILTIPVHAGRDIKRGLLRSQIRIAGLTEDEFYDAL